MSADRLVLEHRQPEGLGNSDDGEVQEPTAPESPTHSDSLPAELPHDVWAIVASHMLPEEWAKACGTCRATSRVQLAKVKAVPWHLQELRWLAKRWSSADVIRLHYMVGNMDALFTGPDMIDGTMAAETQAIEAFSQIGSFHKLRQLGVSADCGTLPDWLSCILSRAWNLHIFKLESVTLPLSPTMTQLKHLKHLMWSFRESRGWMRISAHESAS